MGVEEWKPFLCRQETSAASLVSFFTEETFYIFSKLQFVATVKANDEGHGFTREGPPAGLLPLTSLDLSMGNCSCFWSNREEKR